MFKPSTVLIQEFLVDHLRKLIQETCDGMISAICHDGGDIHDQFKMRDITASLPRIFLRPVVAGEVDMGRLDSIEILHTEFMPFSVSEKNPQISCHMIGRVFWNANMKRELISMRFRFNLGSAHKTNAYITYL